MEYDIRQIVVKSVEEIMHENGSNESCSLDMELNRENGIDSLGFVNLILSIEECLNIELDNELSEIRKCKDVKALIAVLESIM